MKSNGKSRSIEFYSPATSSVSELSRVCSGSLRIRDTGGVQEREGVLDGLIVETLLRGYEDGVARVLRNVG